MTNDERVALREQGYTLQQIADMAGVTKQAVQQSVARRYAFNSKTVSRCVYPNVRDWLIRERLTISGLNRRLGVSVTCAHHTKTMRFLEGKTFEKEMVDAVLKESGMTYEEAFGGTE